VREKQNIFGSLQQCYVSTSLYKICPYMLPIDFTIFSAAYEPSLRQGPQTQSDLQAAWDSKKGLAVRFEKSEKNYLQIFSYKLKIAIKNGKMSINLKSSWIFRCSRAACLRPLVWGKWNIAFCFSCWTTRTPWRTKWFNFCLNVKIRQTTSNFSTQFYRLFVILQWRKRLDQSFWKKVVKLLWL